MLFVGLLVTVILVNEYFRTVFISELKKKNNEIWEELGCPTGYFSSYLFKANGFSLERFILRKKYRALGSELSSKGSTLYAVQIVYLALVALFILAIIVRFGSLL